MTPWSQIKPEDLTAASFGPGVSPDQLEQNRTALAASLYSSATPNQRDGGFNFQNGRLAGLLQQATPYARGEDAGHQGMIAHALQRMNFDRQALNDHLSQKPDSGLSAGTNAIGAPDFSGMPIGDAISAAVHGYNDPVTGSFRGGFSQLAEVPMGAFQWGLKPFGFFGGLSGISNAGDPGFGPGMENGMGAGNPGR